MKNFTFIISMLFVFVASIYGYIANIIALAGTTELVGLTLLRVAGLFLPPIGAVLGFF